MDLYPEPEVKHTADLIEPQERLKYLINYSNTVEVDFHIPPNRYYRSGLEMVRMANVYYKEGNLENAYVLYLKFMTLFLEKIRKHPHFNTVSTQVKATNQAKLREVLSKAEKLKEELLNQYKEEYKRYIAEREAKKRRERRLSIDTTKTDSNIASTGGYFGEDYADVEPPRNVDDIQYPDPSVSSLPSAPPEYKLLDNRDGWHQSRDYSATPNVDRSKKPEFLKPHYTETGLRAVIVPSKLMQQFQSMSQKNTINNVETCGILAGKLAQNELIVTHMILPKQKGTSDSCTTMNEEEIFDFQDQHNLITIGWIHTHPTQTAFLSSVDLHTHCPYQLLMPEAIAIVCAPRYNETGFFMLTPNYGLKFIANCRQSGFHPHPTEPKLFMVADHVRIDENANLEVLDLRK